MTERELAATAHKLVGRGKGILAMDESNSTCNKRFAAVDAPETVEARRAYRELIVTAPHFLTASAARSSMTRRSASGRKTARHLCRF